MIRDRGTPTVQYVTLWQLRQLDVPMGNVGADEGMRMVHMSNIQNLEAIVHLHHLRKTVGGDVSDLIAFTPAMEYAETTVTQAGYERAGRPEVKGSTREAPLHRILDAQAAGDPAVIAKQDELLKTYGFTRDTPMMWGFDIHFHVRPTKGR